MHWCDGQLVLPYFEPRQIAEYLNYRRKTVRRLLVPLIEQGCLAMALPNRHFQKYIAIMRGEAMTYQPPFTISSRAVSLVAEISALVERYVIRLEQRDALKLRRANPLTSCSNGFWMH